MYTTGISEKRFLRRTALRNGETRCNFRQIDNDAIRMVRSREARQVTNLMMHVYVCLLDAPFRFRQSEGELYFNGEMRDEKHLTAWDQLMEVLEVADGTAIKALRWMHEREMIGYYAGKNGAGIRIFINRALSSIKLFTSEGQKNLPTTPTPNCEPHVSRNAIPFNKELRKNEDKKINTFAPKIGTERAMPLKTSLQKTEISQQSVPLPEIESKNSEMQSLNSEMQSIPGNIVARLRDALEPQLRKIAAQTAAREAAFEGERTRQWLERYGLPKAARVAQREAYNVFKHQHANVGSAKRIQPNAQVGRGTANVTRPTMKLCTTSEISEFAEACVMMFEVQGIPIEQTLAQISGDTGGWMMAEDIPRVRQAAQALVLAGNIKLSAKGRNEDIAVK